VVVCVLVAPGTFLLSRFLATIRGYEYRHTDWREGFIKYAVDTGSGAVMYIPSFIKIVSVIQKLIRGITDTQTTWWSHILAFILKKKRKGK
jgi:hypothetical protein